MKDLIPYIISCGYTAWMLVFFTIIGVVTFYRSRTSVKDGFFSSNKAFTSMFYSTIGLILIPILYLYIIFSTDSKVLYIVSSIIAILVSIFLLLFISKKSNVTIKYGLAFLVSTGIFLVGTFFVFLITLASILLDTSKPDYQKRINYSQSQLNFRHYYKDNFRSKDGKVKACEPERALEILDSIPNKKLLFQIFSNGGYGKKNYCEVYKVESEVKLTNELPFSFEDYNKISYFFNELTFYSGINPRKWITDNNQVFIYSSGNYNLYMPLINGYYFIDNFYCFANGIYYSIIIYDKYTKYLVFMIHC